MYIKSAKSMHTGSPIRYIKHPFQYYYRYDNRHMNVSYVREIVMHSIMDMRAIILYSSRKYNMDTVCVYSQQHTHAISILVVRQWSRTNIIITENIMKIVTLTKYTECRYSFQNKHIFRCFFIISTSRASKQDKQCLCYPKTFVYNISLSCTQAPPGTMLKLTIIII